MNLLTFTKKLVFALFAVLFSVNLWGQEPTDLEYCTISGIDDFYQQAGSSAITIGPIVVTDENDKIVDSQYYTISFVYNDGCTAESVINKGKYTVIITGDGTNTVNSAKMDFFVNSSNSFSGGTGEEATPYLISSEDDWITLAYKVYKDETEGMYYKLGSSNVTIGVVDGGNITRNGVMIGDDYHYFSGDFDGNGKTLTFYYDAPTSVSFIAPLYSTSNANIHDVTIEGKITTSYGSAAGLMYSSFYYITTVDNVIVGMDINASGVEHCGGFDICGYYTDYSNCIYKGKIVAGDNSGGFSGYYDSDEITFTNCFFNPEAYSSISSGYTFGMGDDFTTCYYTDNLGTTAQGKEAYAYSDIPNNTFVKKVTVNNTTVYGKVTVSGIEDFYPFDGSDHYVAIKSAVTFDDDITASDTTFTIKKGDDVVNLVVGAGLYTVTIAGQNDNYPKSFTKTIEVIDNLTGGGTSDEPYLIRNAADWFVFANKVNTGVEGYASAYYRLTNDITVTTTMVGTPDHKFSGTFTGQVGATNELKTLTFNYGTSLSPTNDSIIAPFRYTQQATIKYLKVEGAIYTNAGKEAGLIGVNQHASAASDTTSVYRVIVNVALHCGEELWNEEGGGFAYKGGGVRFNSCAYGGYISTANYMGGFCGNADSRTSFKNCLFNPAEGGIYWAENFVYNQTGTAPSYASCYYTLGNNQESSEQGTRVYVGEMPTGAIGQKLTELYGVKVFKPVTVLISGISNTYLYPGLEGDTIAITPVVKFDGNVVTSGTEYTVTITPRPVHDVGPYTLTVAGKNANNYYGSIIKAFRVVEAASEGWAELQTLLSGAQDSITLTKDYTAGESDLALTIDRNVKINLNGHTINRLRNDDSYVNGGHVIKIGVDANVVIYGRGIITGGRNQAPTDTEHGENCDGGGIYNKGHLTLMGRVGDKYDTIFVMNNKCVKKDADNPGMYRTARGGGIYSAPGSTLTIRGCVIRDNESQGGGGGIYSEKATFTMSDNSVVRSNKSLDKGGGLRVDAHNGSANITNSEISSNTVEYHNAQSASNGGGIHLDDGILNLTDCVIKNNNSSKYGGGIYILKGMVNATNCSVLYNQSYDASDKFEGYGGGVCIMGGAYNMDGGTVAENSSYIEKGGGIFVNAGKTLKIKGVVNISGNWKYDDPSLDKKSNTNVHIMGSGATDYITINGSIAGSFISVSKTGEGVFTNGLKNHGNIANFSSDEEGYHIFPEGDEAKLGIPEDLNPDSAVIVDGLKVLNITEATVLDKKIPDETIDKIIFSGDGCLHVEKDGYIKTTIINPIDPNRLVLENGGQVFLHDTNTHVKATMKKDIEAALALAQSNWYLISSPLNENSNPISITANTNLIKMSGNDYPEYDLYRLNESASLQWENYRAHSATDFQTLESARGYLYRNTNDYTINMFGTLNTGGSGITCTLSCGSSDDRIKGFNIIGNPYSHEIYKGAATSAIPNSDLIAANYYVLNQENEDPNYEPSGMWQLTEDGTAIPPMTGILVQAKNGGNFTMANTMEGKVTPSRDGRDANKNLWFTIADDKYYDRACVEFHKGHGLNKIPHLNENAPMLYVNYNGEDFASAEVNSDTKAINLDFEAKATSMFTLSCKANGNFSYLHLIDKVAGCDVDLLNGGDYSFIGMPGDSKDRFVVRLSETVTDSHGNVIFAYQNGNDIIVSGEGELQIFDVMGRMIATQRINGVETVNVSTTGVYIFKLNEKTQKIVVR